MLPSPSELEYFLETAATLNMSRAAERLGISQPALTLAIKRLEDGFGQPLLLRSKTGVALTKAGEKLVISARVIISDWERLRGEAGKDESEIRGRYTIGCHPSVALYTLPSILPALFKNQPRLEVKLRHDLSRHITEDVVSLKVDFGIVVNPARHPDLVVKKLTRDEVSLWVGPSETSLQNLESNESILIFDPDLLQTQSILRQISKRKIKFHRYLNSSSLEVIASLVSEGCGIGILPGRVATRNGALGLRRLLGVPFKFEDEICLVYRANAQKSIAAKFIIEEISNFFKGDPS